LTIFASWGLLTFGILSFQMNRFHYKFWATFFVEKCLCVQRDEKMFWATFWSLFTQKHPVTLSKRPTDKQRTTDKVALI
jgi:hypothetical protein